MGDSVAGLIFLSSGERENLKTDMYAGSINKNGEEALINDATVIKKKYEREAVENEKKMKIQQQEQQANFSREMGEQKKKYEREAVEKDEKMKKELQEKQANF